MKNGDAYISVNKFSTKLPMPKVMNLTVEGLKGSMYDFSTSPRQVLGSNFHIYSFKTLLVHYLMSRRESEYTHV